MEFSMDKLSCVDFVDSWNSELFVEEVMNP